MAKAQLMLHHASNGDCLPAEDHHGAGPQFTFSNCLVLQTCVGTVFILLVKYDLNNLATGLVFSIVVVNSPSWPLASRSP